jgi:hypothetical protein
LDDTVVEIESEVKRVIAALTAPIHVAMQQICAALCGVIRSGLPLRLRPDLDGAIDDVVADG